jgi:hypothetical protein
MYSGKIAVPPGGGGIVVRFMMGNKWLSTTKVADRKFRKLAVFIQGISRVIMSPAE